MLDRDTEAFQWKTFIGRVRKWWWRVVVRSVYEMSVLDGTALLCP